MEGLTDRRTSSYSVGNGGNCIAVGTAPRAVCVEDSQQDHQPARDRLTVATDAWQTFLNQIR
ncbi:MAG: DUF397 domain-containing protein [Streptosporangiales bacterium]|jgi:hypothetical protein|nr:DUF397 domain-containing protein [Streptosporangiales bacterium]